LIIVLSVVLSIPARAQSGGPIGYNGPIVGPIVAVGVALVVITVVIVHEARKKRIATGCVALGENGMSMTDEKDKRVYALSGNTAGIRHGDRVTLQGKKANPKDANAPLAWEVRKETKDFGTCQP
jgi:hypothetical protein